MDFDYKKQAKKLFINLNDYFFDEQAAGRVVRFIEKFATHTKGELMGRPLLLEPWQKELIYNIFGWKRKSDQTRKYRTVYLEVPRKNGKTTLIAGIALYLTCADNEKGAEVYTAAGSKEQAKIMHEITKQMIRQNKTLSKKLKVLTNSISFAKTSSFYQALSKESTTKHGFNAHGVIFDELHVQKDRDLWDTLTTSTGSRSQPLTIAITTAGTEKQSLCYNKHQYAEKVNKGIVKDPSFLGVIYAASPKDDIKSPQTWKKANPGFGTSCKPSFFEDELRKIKEDPAYEDTFKRLCLNIWGETFKSWITDSKFMEAGKEIDKQSLKGAVAMAGLDLSSISDFTSLTLHFHEEEEFIQSLYFFWLPSERYETRKKDMPDIAKWKQEGFLKITPGNVIDYDLIVEDIIKISEEYRIEKLAYDPWGGERVAVPLQDKAGLNVSKYSQVLSYMAPPTKEMQRLIFNKKYNHGFNPIFRWMMSNITLYQDANGNFKIHKGKSGENVDGPVSAVTALGQYMADNLQENQTKSIYETSSIVHI